MRKARDSQRQADKENDAQGGSKGYKGPDGSGQWVSLGELDPNENLDQALNSLAGGETVHTPQSLCHLTRNSSPKESKFAQKNFAEVAAHE